MSYIRPCKALGPDGLKTCVNELTDPLTKLCLFYFCYVLPNMWWLSFIWPLRKKVGAKNLENFRPVALTLILGWKGSLVIILSHIYQSKIHQFAYKPQRGTEDATLNMVDTIATHLQQAKAYVRALIIDYTSAFKYMQIHLLLEHQNMLTPKSLCSGG